MEQAGASTINGRTDLVRLFFSSAGRMGRGSFLAAMTVLLALFAIYEEAVHGRAHDLTGWAVHLPLLFSAACLLSKRLHDRGRAGWWAFLPLWAFGAAWPVPEGFFGAVAVVMLVGAAVDLGVLPGTAGFNRFGPRPG